MDAAKPNTPETSKPAPSEKKPAQAILVVDPDPTLPAQLKADPKAQAYVPLVLTSGKDAQLALADTTNNFVGVFVNPKITPASALSVIRFAHQHRPATPIYLIHDGKFPFSEQDLKMLPVQEVLQKPIALTKMVELVAPLSQYYDQLAAIDSSNPGGERLDTELTIEDQAFIPIRATDFISGSKAYFDVYVRISSGKYLKILQAGDSFTFDRLMNYLNKGVKHFYLRRESQQRYLAYCDQLATAIVKSQKVAIDVKITQTLNQGEETLNFLRDHGVNPTNLHFAQNFVTNVKTLTKQIKLDEVEVMRSFISDIALYDHGVGVSMIASLLLQPLQVEADKSVKIVGVAALLHDIGLQYMPPEVKNEDESTMDGEQITLYQTHPLVGADMLKGIQGIDPSAIQAVAQHHERRNKMGFPARSGAGTINRIAEIIGISDEFNRLLQKAMTNPKLNILQEMEIHVFKGFSHPIVEAFRMVFFFRK